MCDIRAFCQLTGRTLSARKEYQSLINIVYNQYLTLTGLKDSAPQTVVTDDGEFRAFHTVGDWNGVVIDETYTNTLELILNALLH